MSLLKRREIWFVLLAAQFLAAMWMMRPWTTSDSAVYLELSRSLAHGSYGSVLDGGYQPDALRPPGYPLILAAFHDFPLAIVVVLQLALCGWALFLVDVRLGGSLAFRFLTLIYPFPSLYSASIMGEAYAMIAITYVAIMMTRPTIRPIDALVAGAVAGLVALVRSDLILVPALVFVILLVRRYPLRIAILTPVVAIAVLLPYTLWNFAHFSRLSPVPVATSSGNSLYLATWQEKLPLADLRSLYGTPSPRARESGLVAEVATTNARFGAPPNIAPFNPADYHTNRQRIASASYYGDLAIDRIKKDPTSYLGHCLKSLFRLWNSALPSAPPPITISLRIVSALVWLLGMCGAAASLWRRDRLAAAVPFLFYPVIFHMMLHTEARYTAASRGLLLMFAAVALASIAHRLARPNRMVSKTLRA